MRLNPFITQETETTVDSRRRMIIGMATLMTVVSSKVLRIAGISARTMSHGWRTGASGAGCRESMSVAPLIN